MATDVIDQDVVPEHRDRMPEGWEYGLKRFRELAERKAAARGNVKG